jgi:hypothetical protein
VAQAVDEEVSALIASRLEGVVLDRTAFEHQLAHPTEMQLPFISRIRPDALVVLISFYDYEKVVFPGVTAAQVEAWGKGLAELVTELEQEGREILLVGTTDLSHYEPLAVNDPWDADMMEAMTRLDVEALRKRITEGKYSICGEIAVSIFLTTLRHLGYSRLDWWTRGNSSHLSGPDGVVGYPGGVVWR